MTVRRLVAAISIGTVLAVALALAPVALARDAVLRIGTTSRPTSLNPFAAANRGAQAVLSLVYDTLVTAATPLAPEPGLASGWKSSRDRRTWQFTIRSGVSWSDGVLLSAEDVAYSLQRALQSRGPLARYLEGVDRIEPITPTVVVVRLSRPLARFPDVPVPIVPKHVWETVTDRELLRYANEPPVGSGPFRLVRSTDRVIRLAANADYWGGRPAVDAVEFRLFDDDAALADALRAGRVDVADDLAPAAFDELRSDPALTAREAPGTTFVSLGMNTGSPRGQSSPVLRDRVVRQAIAMAINRDAVRLEALGGHGESGTTIVPPASPFHATIESPLVTHDRARAIELLRRAGYRDRDRDGTIEGRDRFPVRLRLATRSSLPESQAAARVIVENLAGIGIAITVEELTDAELSRRIRNGNVELFVWGWSTELDPNIVLSALTCAERTARGLNDTWFCNARYDRLYEEQLHDLDPASRRELVARLQRLAAREAPYVVLYYRPWLQAYRRDRVTGLEATPSGEPLLFGASARKLTLVSVSVQAPPPRTPVGSPGAIADALDSDRLWWAIAGGAVLLTIVGWVVLTNRSERVLAREQAEREKTERRQRDEARRRSANRVVTLETPHATSTDPPDPA